MVSWLSYLVQVLTQTEGATNRVGSREARPGHGLSTAVGARTAAVAVVGAGHGLRTFVAVGAGHGHGLRTFVAVGAGHALRAPVPRARSSSRQLARGSRTLAWRWD